MNHMLGRSACTGTHLYRSYYRLCSYPAFGLFGGTWLSAVRTECWTRQTCPFSSLSNRTHLTFLKIKDSHRVIWKTKTIVAIVKQLAVRKRYESTANHPIITVISGQTDFGNFFEARGKNESCKTWRTGPTIRQTEWGDCLGQQIHGRECQQSVGWQSCVGCMASSAPSKLACCPQVQWRMW